MMSRRRAVSLDWAGLEASARLRGCDHPGCVAEGEFRAPRARNRLDEYYWFCLDHVRSYNAAWDYYRGMSPAEIERCRREDIVGGRPSWPLGRQGPAFHFRPEELRAALNGLFGAAEIPGPGAAPKPPRRPPTPHEEALAALDLGLDATQAELKARYKALVKLHHPDANGGDKAAEERLKSINQAYTVLKEHNVKLSAGG
jgi:hypothetical protein